MRRQLLHATPRHRFAHLEMRGIRFLETPPSDEGGAPAVETPTDPPALTQADLDAAITAAQTQTRTDIANQISQAFGITPTDNAPDPAALAAQALETARTAQLNLSVYQAAAALGADPVALLDSRAFTDAVAQLDPTDAPKIQAAITTALAANPRLKAAPQQHSNITPAPGGGEGSVKSMGLHAAITNAYAK